MSMIKDIPVFDLEDLNGMTLKIHVGTDVADGCKNTVVMGTDESSGITYFISSTTICVKKTRISLWSGV